MHIGPRCADTAWVENGVAGMSWARVVIVDDDPTVRLVASLGLSKKAGVEVVGEAGTLAEARKLLITRRPDIVVLDNDMPDGSGVDFLSECRLLHSTGVVVLFTSASVDRSETSWAKAVIDKRLGGVEELVAYVLSLRPEPESDVELVEDVTHTRVTSTAGIIRSGIRR